MPTIAGVELAKTGRFEVSTGPFLVTPAKLAAAVAAAESGQFPAAVVKLGHVDPRFDGEPALGTVRRLRLTDSGRTLVGDLEDVPEWLHRVAAGAYPHRSIEAEHGVTAPDGSQHALVLRAVALLGQTRPGIGTLADLERELTAASAASPLLVLASATTPAVDHLTPRQRVAVRAAAARRRHRTAAAALRIHESS